MSIAPTSLKAQAAAPVHRELFDSMQDWIRAGDPLAQAHRERLVENVRVFLVSANHLLEIRDLDISELPQFLCHPTITRQLQQLSVARTLIEQVPEWLDQLSQLETLVVEDNFHLDGLPQSIGNLSRLTCLDISFLDPFRELQEFEFPDSLRRLRLDSLALSGIEGPLIQTWLDSQVNLRRLRLNNCDYHEIPNEIFQLRQLSDLDLTGNNISVVDDRIQNLIHLERVDFSSNTITSVNDGIFGLDGGCEVNLQENHLSAEELARIDSIIEDDAYRGPGFTTDAEAYDSSAASLEEEPESLEDVLRTFYANLHQPQPRCLEGLIHDVNIAPVVLALLQRLQKNIPPTHSIAPQAFASLAKSLSLAALDPEFKRAFFNLVEGATRTCGDGILAIILKLGLLRQEISLDLEEPRAVLEFILRGKFAMSILESSASLLIQQKIHSIELSIKQAHPLMGQEELSERMAERVDNEIDPVEVYLIYPIELRDRLRLPLELEDMFFRPASRVARKDLDEAAENVERALANQASIIDFLIEDELWLRLLEKEYPEVFAELMAKQEQLGELSEGAAAEDPYVAFAKAKKEALLEMTARLLEKLQSPENLEAHRPKRKR